VRDGEEQACIGGKQHQIGEGVASRIQSPHPAIDREAQCDEWPVKADIGRKYALQISGGMDVGVGNPSEIVFDETMAERIGVDRCEDRPENHCDDPYLAGTHRR